MIWVVLVFLVILVIIRLSSRSRWFLLSVLGFENSDGINDVLNWIILHYDWSKLNDFIIDSVQERFKKQAPTGWSLKFDGRSSFTPNSQLARIQLNKSWSKNVESSNFVIKPSQPPGTILPTNKLVPELELSFGHGTQDVAFPTRTPTKFETSKTFSKTHPIIIHHVHTKIRKANELVLAAELVLSGWSHNVCITCRQASQLQSNKCQLDLINLTGKMNVRIEEEVNENVAWLTTCFKEAPTINMTLSNSDFQEETRQIAENILKNCINNLILKFPLFKTVALEKRNAFDAFTAVTKSKIISQETIPEQVTKEVDKPNKLFIKIVKANALYSEGTYELHCLVSIDSPSQNQQTSSVADTSNPFFDERLSFDLDDTTKRISFEIQDKSAPPISLGKTDLLLKDVPNDMVEKNKAVRMVLPLMAQQATSHKSLTVEVQRIREKFSGNVTSTLNGGTGGLCLKPLQPPNDGFELSQKYESKPPLPPSVSVQLSPDSCKTLSHETVGQVMKVGHAATESNISLVSHGSLLIRNNENLKRGRSKQKSIIDAMKSKFRRKNPRSRSADTSQAAAKPFAEKKTDLFSDGIYLTPPPKRGSLSGQIELWSKESSSNLAQEDKRKNRSHINIINLFRKKSSRQNSSPSSLRTK